MPFKLPFTHLVDQTGHAALQSIQEAQKKPIGDVRVYDLLLHQGVPVLNGVYAFYSSRGECLYVGKNSAQKFVERIPWHFAIDESAWMNHYLKRTRQFGKLETLVEAAEAARNDLLLLIPVEPIERLDVIKTLEKFLRVFAIPTYNAYSSSYRKRYEHLRLDSPLMDILAQM